MRYRGTDGWVSGGDAKPTRFGGEERTACRHCKGTRKRQRPKSVRPNHADECTCGLCADPCPSCSNSPAAEAAPEKNLKELSEPPEKCPNCKAGFALRVAEGRCAACGYEWGVGYEVGGKKKSEGKGFTDGEVVGCAMVLAVLFVPTLVLVGIGWAALGFGGGILGLGLGVATTIAIFIKMMMPGKKQ